MTEDTLNAKTPWQDLTIGGNIFIGKRRIENGVANYHSIRDGKKMWTESEIDEIIGLATN